VEDRTAAAPVLGLDAPAMGAADLAADGQAQAGAARAVLGLAGLHEGFEDSRHTQTLVKLLVQQHFPQADSQLADDGIAGLAVAGHLQPDELLVDILLPGIDGATMISGLRSHPAFGRMRLIVVTGLDADQRQPYAFALQGVPVAHKPRLAIELPALLAQALAAAS